MKSIKKVNLIYERNQLSNLINYYITEFYSIILMLKIIRIRKTIDLDHARTSTCDLNGIGEPFLPTGL